MEETKICSKCKFEKSINDFSKNKSKKDGLNSHCNKCRKEYRDLNKEKIANAGKKYRENNAQKISEYKRNYYLNNKDSVNEKGRIYYSLNRERVLKKVYEYRSNNLDKVNSYYRKRRESDYIFKLTGNLRNRTVKAFNRGGYSKNSKTGDLLGADWKVVQLHIESRFKDDMSWNNYGKWEIDHIIPLSSAKTEQELINLCHYTNLQPLWSEENLMKADKIIACRVDF